jgi:hypothetical protein
VDFSGTFFIQSDIDDDFVGFVFSYHVRDRCSASRHLWTPFLFAGQFQFLRCDLEAGNRNLLA